MATILSKNCLVCGRLFEKPVNESLRSWSTRRKYCSKKCLHSSPRSKETRVKQRLAKLGKTPWNKGILLSEKHKAKLRGKRAPFKDTSKMRGRRPWNKIGDGITLLNERIRKSPKYKLWRKQVFERDDYTCQNCGKHGGTLHADHIKPFALYPELRFDVSNGRTLCVPCHRNTESFGINQHTHSQFVNIDAA